MKAKETTSIVSVREAVWPWDRAGARDAPAPAGAALRRAMWRSVVMAVIAALFFFFGKNAMACIVSAVAVVLLVLSMVAPPAYAQCEVFFKRLGVWAGAGLTWLLLAPFFYLCFWPACLILRASRRDPMRLGFPSPEASCWTPRARDSRADCYKRQY